MANWIDRLAEALGEEALSDPEVTRLLGAAREVAHRVERRITPLAAFLVGTAAGRRIAGGEPRGDAVRAVLGTLEGLLPEAPEPA